MRKRLNLEMAGNKDDLSLILGLETHKGAALTEVFEVGGEDIVWMVAPVHSLSLRDSRLEITNNEEHTRLDNSIHYTDLHE